MLAVTTAYSTRASITRAVTTSPGCTAVSYFSTSDATFFPRTLAVVTFTAWRTTTATATATTTTTTTITTVTTTTITNTTAAAAAGAALATVTAVSDTGSVGSPSATDSGVDGTVHVAGAAVSAQLQLRRQRRGAQQTLHRRDVASELRIPRQPRQPLRTLAVLRPTQVMAREASEREQLRDDAALHAQVQGRFARQRRREVDLHSTPSNDAGSWRTCVVTVNAAGVYAPPTATVPTCRQ